MVKKTLLAILSNLHVHVNIKWMILFSFFFKFTILNSIKNYIKTMHIIHSSHQGCWNWVLNWLTGPLFNWNNTNPFKFINIVDNQTYLRTLFTICCCFICFWRRLATSLHSASFSLKDWNKYRVWSFKRFFTLSTYIYY